MKMKSLPSYSTSVLMLFVLFLSACDASETTTAKKPSPVLPVSDTPQPSEAPEALAPDLFAETVEKKEVVRFHYNAKGRRDPFQSIVVSRGLRKQTRILGSLPPLQRKDISDLKLIGIVWGSFGPRAIITTSSGKGYTVHIGTKIGVNHGVIKVVVEETLLNIFGEPRKSKVVMVLHSEKERVE